MKTPPPTCVKSQALEVDAVRALLYRCESSAADANVRGFKECLSRKSVARLDAAFAAARRRVDLPLTRWRQLAARAATLHPARRAPLAEALASLSRSVRAARALRRSASWPAHLDLIAKMPRSVVSEVRQVGDQATFRKRFGQRATKHFLIKEAGHWRIDLLHNPDFTRRLDALDRQVKIAVATMAAPLDALSLALNRSTPTRR